MSNKRKRDTISDSEESDIFQEPKRKSIKSPQKRPVREKNSSEEDADDPGIKIVSDSENNSEIESVESDNDKSDSSREMKKKDSKSSEDFRNLKATFFYEELSSDDELYTFQCPDKFNIESLKNLELDMNEVSQIKDKNTGEVYDMKFENQSKMITCAVPSRKKTKLVSLPINGHVLLLRDVNVPNVKLESDKNENIDFPNDLKVRHPLLGVDWKDHIRNSNKILNGGDEKGSRSPKKRKVASEKRDEVDGASDEDWKEKSSKKLKSPEKEKRNHDVGESQVSPGRPKRRKRN